MALPKGKLMALLAVFAAIGIITATGAFTQVTADRSAEVATAGDANANLGLAPYDGPNGNPGPDQTDDEGYAKLSSGTLELNLAGYDSDATGVNLDAVTKIDNVFNITNNGAQNITISITKTDEQDESNGESDRVTFYNGPVDDGNVIDGTTTLTPGETMVVSIEIDTTGDTEGFDSDGDGDLLDQITIEANSES